MTLTVRTEIFRKGWRRLHFFVIKYGTTVVIKLRILTMKFIWAKSEN
jgi:hypothetical protein